MKQSGVAVRLSLKNVIYSKWKLRNCVNKKLSSVYLDGLLASLLLTGAVLANKAIPCENTWKSVCGDGGLITEKAVAGYFKILVQKYVWRHCEKRGKTSAHNATNVRVPSRHNLAALHDDLVVSVQENYFPFPSAATDRNLWPFQIGINYDILNVLDIWYESGTRDRTIPRPLSTQDNIKVIPIHIYSLIEIWIRDPSDRVVQDRRHF
jgi:hypothetical protein